MGRLKIQNAYLELQQLVSGNAILLAAHGSQELKQGEGKKVKVPGSSWQIAYWSAGSSGVGPDNVMIFTGVFIGILLVPGILLFVMYRRLTGVLKAQARPGVRDSTGKRYDRW